MKRFLLFICYFISVSFVFAQRNSNLWLNEVPLVVDSASQKIYITLEPTALRTVTGTLRWNEEVFSHVKLNTVELENAQRNNFHISDWSSDTPNTLTLVDNQSKDWTLVFSTLPFVLIDCPLSEMSKNYSTVKGDENHTKKYPGYINVIDARCRTKVKDSELSGMPSFYSAINIRLRGATSGSAYKKSFNVELTKDGESNDVHLLGYRKDDDWILSAEYTDYSRIRNRVIMDLWNSVDDLPYDKDNKYQCNGTQGEFVEVFVNGAYYGLFCFTDKIDRKKLNLKKTKEATETTAEVKRGLLWKANWECGETYMSGYSQPATNDSLLWPWLESKQTYGWEQKYPADREDQAFFTPICDAIDLINDNALFRDTYKDKLYEQNVTDFILFIQAFQLIDNQKKNYYLSVRNYNSEEKFLFTPWDLDGSIGRLAGGDIVDSDTKQMAWGEKLGYHALIHRFKSKNLRPSDFATTMNNRWQYLRTHQLSLANVRAKMEKYGNLLTYSGAWQRERDFWGPKYKRVSKIADTPQEEIEFMMSFLEKNYALFDEVMSSSSWPHDEYDEENYAKTITLSSLYIIGPDVVSKHEDNTAIMPGNVQRELVKGIDYVEFKDNFMSVVRADETKDYNYAEIKEVRTSNEHLYETPAFIPDSLKDYFEFDTRFASNNYAIATHDSLFSVMRTIQVAFDGNSASIIGNLDGFEARMDSSRVEFTTELEGVQYLISGASETGSIKINSLHPCKIAAADEGALLSSIDANCNITINTPNTLNFYNDVFDGKCISTTGDVSIENGDLYFLMTGSGTLTDADFLANPTLGARAIMANNITIYGGNIYVKTLGHNGAVGLAAVKKININGGNSYIATYDDPIKVGSSVTINGGFTITSSLTNDGLDSKGDVFVNGGMICSYGPEGAEAAFDANHFYANGGTVIGVGYKSEYPAPSKSKQAAFRLYKNKDVKRYLKVMDADNNEIAMIETPSYPVLTVVYSSPKLKKGDTYTLLTGNSADSMQKLTTIVAE